jgi:hypothetical protein
MTGPAADAAELKTLAAAGVLRLREVPTITSGRSP